MVARMVRLETAYRKARAAFDGFRGQNRQVLGLSQRKLGKRIDVDPKAIELCERGARPISKKILKFLKSF